jgi:hypothetical protein
VPACFDELTGISNCCLAECATRREMVLWIDHESDALFAGATRRVQSRPLAPKRAAHKE